MTLLRLDHFAMSCVDLDAAARTLEERLGVVLSPRGEHKRMGTHNRLLGLGPDIYFELIAIDPGMPGPDHPRWFNLDAFSGPPRLTNWIVATDTMDTALKTLPDGMGTPLSLTRGDFAWNMAVPPGGVLPFDGWAPALIEWQGPAHPAPRLDDQGVRLQSLTLFHPQADELAQAFTPHLPRDTILCVPSDTPRLEARLSTPDGDVVLE